MVASLYSRALTTICVDEVPAPRSRPTTVRQGNGGPKRTTPELQVSDLWRRASGRRDRCSPLRGAVLDRAVVPTSERRCSQNMLAIWSVAAHAFCPGASALGGHRLTTTRSRVLAVASTLPDEEERLGVAEPSLETEDPRKATPPPRGVNVGGYVCPPEKCTWLPFQYAPPSVRRATVKHFVDDLGKMPTLPPMKIWCDGPTAYRHLHLHLHLHLPLSGSSAGRRLARVRSRRCSRRPSACAPSASARCCAPSSAWARRARARAPRSWRGASCYRTLWRSRCCWRG